MKIIHARKLFLLCFLLLSIFLFPPTISAYNNEPEHRAVWLQDVNDLDNKLQKLKAMHINTIYFGVWGSNDLQTVINKVHALGMHIHLWEANAYLCAGHWQNCSTFIVGKDDWDARLPNGMTREDLTGPGNINNRWIDFGSPEVQQNAINVMVNYVNNYQADGVHFDYIRYDSGNYSFSDGNLQQFNSRYGINPDVMTGVQFPAFGTLWGNRVSSLLPTTTLLANFQDNVPAIFINNYSNDSTEKHGQVLTFNWQADKITFKVADDVLRRAINQFNAAAIYVINNVGYNDSDYSKTTNWLKYLGYSSTKITLSSTNISSLPANSTLVITSVYLFDDPQILALNTFLTNGGNIIFIDGPVTTLGPRGASLVNLQMFKNILGASKSDSYIGYKGRDKGMVTVPDSAENHWLVSGLISNTPVTFDQATDYMNKWQTFMEEGINIVVKGVFDQVHQINPNLKVSAAVFPAEEGSNVGVRQNWPVWLTNNYLDYAIPMEYTLDNTKFTNLLTWAISNNFTERIFPGLGPYQITDCSQISIITDQITQLRNQGFRGFSMFESNYLTQANLIPAGCGIANTLTNYFGQDVPPYYPAYSPTPTPKPGDANGDGHVDGVDYVIWVNHFSQHIGGGASIGDFNGDGTIDGVDYVIWVTNFGQ